MNDNLNFKCLFFGHTGEEKESGFHICSLCQKHAYYDSIAIKKENISNVKTKYTNHFQKDLSDNLYLANNYEMNGLFLLPLKKVSEKFKSFKSKINYFYKYKIRKQTPF